MSDPDPLGRAMLDYQRGGLRGQLRYRDGDRTHDGYVYENYFRPPAEWSDDERERARALDGPVLDLGCGAGQHALFLQERREVVAVDVSPRAVDAARERGVDDVRVADMFDLPFDRDRFRSVLMNGTQLGLAGSFAGVRELLCDVARITDEQGVALVDNYDPTNVDADSLLGYRPDPRRGVARRTFHFEYDRRESDGEFEVGYTLDFLLFGPERLADAVVGTPWNDVEVVGRSESGSYYKARLTK